MGKSRKLRLEVVLKGGEMLIERLLAAMIGVPQLVVLAGLVLVIVASRLFKGGSGKVPAQLWAARFGLIGAVVALWSMPPAQWESGISFPMGSVAYSVLVGGPLPDSVSAIANGEAVLFLAGILGGSLAALAGLLTTFLLPLWWCNAMPHSETVEPGEGASQTDLTYITLMIMLVVLGGISASMGQGLLPSITGMLLAYVSVLLLTNRVRRVSRSATTQNGEQRPWSRLAIMGVFGFVLLGGGLLLLYGGYDREAARTATGMVLALAGLGFWLFLVPFGSWMSDMAEELPEWLSGLMMGALPMAALAILLRLMLHMYGGAAGVPSGSLSLEGAGLVAWGSGSVGSRLGAPALLLFLLFILGWVTMLASALMALVQSSLRRLLFCSISAHWGFMFIMIALSLATASQSGSGATMVPVLIVQVARYLLYLSLAVWGILAVSAFLARRSSQQHMPVFFSTLTGLGEVAPALAFSMMIFSVSMAGMPPAAGFAGRQGLTAVAMHALVSGGTMASMAGNGSQSGGQILSVLGGQSGMHTLGWTGVISVLLAAIILATPFLRLIITMYMRAAHHRPNWPGQCEVRGWTSSVLAVLVVISGLFYMAGIIIPFGGGF